jgi:hypothetical protein
MSTGIDILAIIISIIASAISGKALWNSKKVQQFNSVDKVLSDVTQIDTDVADLYKLYHNTKDKELLKTYFEQILSKLFNRLDWISFLINKKQIKDKSLLEYIYPIIIIHYEETFLPCATKGMKKPSEFKNLKSLYEKIKNDKKILKLI